MRATREELLLMNLCGEFDPSDRAHYQPKEEALAELRKLTGQDFGDDARKWEDWFLANDPGAVDWDGWLSWSRRREKIQFGVLLLLVASLAVFIVYREFLAR